MGKKLEERLQEGIDAINSSDNPNEVRLTALSHLLRMYNIAKREMERADREHERATTDPLTGAKNIRWSDENGIDLPTPYVVLRLDVDDLKGYNDNYGHNQADCALITLVETINKEIRKTDKVIRKGGDEFHVVLANVREKDTYHVAEKLRKAVEDMEIPNKGSFKDSGYERITVSIGAASSESMPNKGALDLEIEADKACYTVKEAGGNKVEVAPAKYNK